MMINVVISMHNISQGQINNCIMMIKLLPSNFYPPYGSTVEY